MANKATTAAPSTSDIKYCLALTTLTLLYLQDSPHYISLDISTSVLALQALLTHTKSVLSSALKVWPNAAVKVNYISKLLSNSAHNNIDPPPTLLTGLDVMNTLVDLQPEKMVQECGAELVLMMDPCFASKHHQISQRLGSLLVKLYEAMGEPKQEQPNPQLMVQTCL